MLVYFIHPGHAADADGLCVGQSDRTLSERGTREVHDLLANWTGPTPARLATSDSHIAAETAALAQARWDRAAEVDARLRDLDFGEWEGKRWSDIEHDDKGAVDRWMTSWVTVAPPGGETFTELAIRAGTWWDDTVRTLTPGDILAVVAHAGSTRALLCQLLAIPLERAFMFRLDPGRVTGVALTDAGGELLFANAPSPA